MARLRANAVFGTLTSSLSAVATSITNSGFVDLPAVSSPDVLVITLDPDEVNGPAEIVHVTVHGSGTDTVTVARNQENTTARSHPSGTKWVHAPTAKDFEITDLVTVTGTTEVTVAGSLVLSGNPTGTNQAANKGYVDQVAAGQRFKDACRCATTANVTIATALNAGDTIDGITLVAGDRVLVKDQSTQSQNGIYVAGTTPARATDADTGTELDTAAVFVTSGTVNEGTSWVQTTNNPTIDSSAIVWSQTGGGRTTADEVTLTKVGSTMSIKDLGVTVGKIANSTGATASQYLNGTGGWTTPTASGTDVTIVSGTTLAALQAARGTVAGGATGRRVYVPAGTYTLTGVLDLNVPGQSWELHPQAVLTRNANTSPGQVLTISSTDIRVSGGTIDGGDPRALPRSGRSAAINDTTVSGINAVTLTSSAARVTIEKMTIRNAFNNAVSTNSSSSIRLQNLYILNSGGTAINGTANASDVEGLVVEGCLIDRTGYTGNASYYGGGIKLMGDQNDATSAGYRNRGMRIIGNDIRQPYLNFADGDGDGGNECVVYQEPNSKNGLVASNVCVGGSIGISFSKNYGGTIIGNTVYGFAKLGLEVSNGDFCTVTGNIVDGGMGAGENRVPSVTRYHNGIAIWTGAADTTVTGNTVRNLRALDNSYGVILQEDGGLDGHVTISNNVISVRDNATGIYANKIYGTTIVGNQIRCDESGTTTSTSATTGIDLGIENSDAARTGRFIVSNNQVRKAAVAIRTSGTGTIKDTLITNNVLYDDCTSEYAKGGSVTIGSRTTWANNVGSAAAASRSTLS